MEVPEWSLPKKLTGHCTVALNEFQVMVIGKAIKIWLNFLGLKLRNIICQLET